ncbi:MAG: GNAT family N-acetyltransferase [Firmicutes bacterium]|nr:GNAT family N-acetyltransferase [Bacillota bacterium]
MSQLMGERIWLRPVETRDLPVLAEWDQDPEICRYTQSDYPGQPLKTSTRNKVHYAVILNNKLIGDIELDHIAWRSGDAELKVRIGSKNLWNQGYGTDAVLTILNYAFRRVNLSRIYLRVYSDNTRAIRCYKKAGFKKEGRLQRMDKQNSENTTEIILMRILKSEFLKLHKSFYDAV